MKLKCLLIFYFIIINIFLFSENILLKDGSILKGKLVKLSKEKVSLLIEDKLFEFNLYSIEYLIANLSQNDYTSIILVKNDMTEEHVNLIKLTEQAMYYKYPKDNELRIIKSVSIKELKLTETFDINLDNKIKYKYTNEIKTDLNKDILLVIELLLKNKNKSNVLKTEQIEELKLLSNNYILDYENSDFYEKFWALVQKYINTNTENLLWELLEDYSNKEKSISITYNDTIKDEKIKSNIKNNIIEFRKNFYIRAKKIILSYE